MTQSAARPMDLAHAADLLHREARYLDERRWDDWLALFHAQAVFWVPAWKSEDRPTEDPANEVSLIYLSSRVQIGERIARVRSRRSAASTPLPRTAHALSNIQLGDDDAGDAATIFAVNATHLFDVRRREQHVLVGRCEYRMEQDRGDWRIRMKKVTLLNDYISTIIDFYSL